MNALSQGMGGLALILSFGLLCARRTGLALLLFGLQGLAVSVAVAAQHALSAAALNAVSVLAVPWLARQWAVVSAAGDRTWSMPVTLAAAAVLSLVAAAAGTLALPLAILLLGLLLVGARPSPILQALGLCSLQQAAVLAASGLAGTAPLLPIAVAVPVLPALALAALLLHAAGGWPTGERPKGERPEGEWPQGDRLS
ncbi:MAG: hypothetical protein P4L71_16665 [Acetobacteraceae bacterium]|nr:hypothetical protein [Acetobacteraceae bacterium]